MIINSDNSDNSGAIENKPDDADKKTTDSRYSAEDQVYLDKIILAQKSKELEAQKKTESEAKGNYETRINTLEEENKKLKEKRVEELLSFLDEGDQKKYKDKTVEQLEMLVEWIKDHPNQKKGMKRKPSTKGTSDKRQLDAGTVGSYNIETRKWE